MKSNRPLNFFIAVVLLLLSGCAAFAQAPLTQQQQELADFIKSHYTKHEVMIPMRDGVKLFTSIYAPRDTKQKYPVMLDRTCYSVAPYGQDKFRTLLGPDELFAREGYIVVYQDVRGRYMSEGEFEDVRPYIPNKHGNQIDETSDTYDTVDWLIKNVPNNNGCVGVWGISYPGFYTSMAGINGHPAVKAISPQAPVSDWFHGDDMHHNGALFLAQNYSFFASFGQPRPMPTGNNDYRSSRIGGGCCVSKLPVVSGAECAKGLGKVGFVVFRQRGVTSPWCESPRLHKLQPRITKNWIAVPYARSSGRQV